MYSITATRSIARISAARAGSRRRRNPLLVMRDGSAIKLAPGRTVTISDEAYLYNLNLINEFSDCLVVRNLSEVSKDRTEADTEPPQEIPPPVPEEQPQEEEEAVQEPVVEEVVEEVAPASEKSVEEKPKRRRRKSTKVSEEAESTKEEAPKKRRRSRKAST